VSVLARLRNCPVLSKRITADG